MLKRMLLLGLLVGAVGVPILATTGGDWVKKISTVLGGGDDAKPGPADLTKSNEPAQRGNEPAGGPREPRLEGLPTHDLTEVLRFDATPAWIMSRWSRVSTVPADVRLQGYRVALVTGTNPDDLAGALTYYFGPDLKVQRIKFVGATGDPSKLVNVVTRRYGLTRKTTRDAGVFLYQRTWNNDPVSELEIRPAAVVRTEAPLTRFRVNLEINQLDGRLSRLSRDETQEEPTRVSQAKGAP